MTDCTGILAARNRTKRKMCDYRYEAMQNVMELAWGSASEFSFACCALALRSAGKPLPFLKPEDELILKKLRAWIAHLK